MTIKEIEESLPHGFHDAVLENINFEMENLTLILGFNMWIDLEGEADTDIWRKSNIIIKNISFFAIDPYFLFVANKNRPRPKNKWGPEVFGFSNQMPKEIKINRAMLNKNHLIANFFMGDENIFYNLIISYETAEFKWVGEPIVISPPEA